jgi:hypothetical protein
MQTFPLELDNALYTLKSDENKKMNKSLGLKIDSNLNIRNQNNKMIVPKEQKQKNMDAISKPLISGHLQRKKTNSKCVIVFL